MPEGLRSRQKRLAREAILEAVAEHVADSGLFDFSIPEIARMAGVSHRTVYNYFPNREVLLDEFSDWAGQRMDDLSGISFPAALDGMPEAARRYFEVFSQMPGITTAFARVDSGAPGAAVPAGYRQRREAFRRLVAARMPEAGDEEIDAVTGLLSVLGSSMAWYRLTTDHGLDGRRAGAAVGWLMDLIVSAVSAGDTPPMPEDRAHTAAPSE